MLPDYDLTEEQARMRKAVREFTREFIAPGAQERDGREEFPLDLFHEMGRRGFVGYPIPREYGGGGGSFLAYCTMVEEMSREDASAALVMSLNVALVITPVLIAGSEEQKKRFLPPLCRGEKVGCFCLTEPEAGSDASNLKTHAREEGDFYVLNGEKIFIQHGNAADFAVVACRIAPREGAAPRISLLAVDNLKETEGVKQIKLGRKMGLRSATTGRLIFENVHVPKENLLGRVGHGFRYVMQTLDGGRIGIAAQAVGIALGAFERAMRWACRRRQFDQPLVQFGQIQSMLADSASEIEAARLMVYKAAQAKDRGEDITLIAAMAKLFATRVANRVVYRAVQVHGGYGYIGDVADLERFYRDARITEIYEGTSQIQELVIARQLARLVENR